MKNNKQALFLMMISVVVSGCGTFGDTSHPKNKLAACWSKATNMAEMKKCEEEMKPDAKNAPVMTHAYNQIEIFNRNEANQRNTTASRA